MQTPPPLAGTVVHDEIVPARAPWIHMVKKGQTLRIVDLEGNQAVDFLMYNASDDAERYSAQDTIAAQQNIFLREGSVLLSNEGAPMMAVAATAVEYHDTIGGACSCEGQEQEEPLEQKEGWRSSSGRGWRERQRCGRCLWLNRRRG